MDLLDEAALQAYNQLVERSKDFASIPIFRYTFFSSTS